MEPKPIPTSPRHDPRRSTPRIPTLGVRRSLLIILACVSLSAAVSFAVSLLVVSEGQPSSTTLGGTIFRNPRTTATQVDSGVLERLNRSVVALYNISQEKMKTAFSLLGTFTTGAVALSDDGWFVAPLEASEDLTSLSVVQESNRESPVLEAVGDPATGLRFVKIASNGFQSLAFADPDQLRAGDELLVVQRDPTTLTLEVTRVSLQNLSARSGDLARSSEVFAERLVVAPAEGVRRGALLATDRGEIVGVALEDSAVFIPAHTFAKRVRDLLTDGRVRRPWLGVTYLELSAATRFSPESRRGRSTGALLVNDGNRQAVRVGSPAARAGLRTGDLILTVNGLPVDRQHSLTTRIQEFFPGTTVTLAVLRVDERIELKVLLEELQP